MVGFGDAVEVIPGRLYWAAVDQVPSDTAHTHLFSVDEELVYQPFCRDFGPLNLSMICHYCWQLRDKLLDPELKGKRIVHCCSLEPEKIANAVCLVGAFQVLAIGRPADEAFAPFRALEPRLRPFRDAARGPCTFELTVPDCLRALELSVQRGWFHLSRFNIESYDYFSQAKHGDMNWIVPGKLLALAGPSGSPVDSDGYPALTPEDYAPLFLQAGVKLAIRLNKPCYDHERFTSNGVRHADLYFRDGSCPPNEIISKFLQIVESEEGAVGVHCKAGLGRTCTLIGLYAMKHFFVPARAMIAWCRICRPGSVLGPQQEFLLAMEPVMFQAGLAARGPQRGPRAPEESVERMLRESLAKLSLKDGRGADYEDAGQGESLCSAKRLVQSAEWSTMSPSSTPVISETISENDSETTHDLASSGASPPASPLDAESSAFAPAPAAGARDKRWPPRRPMRGLRRRAAVSGA